MRDFLRLTDQAAMTSELFTRRGRWSQDQMRLEKRPMRPHLEKDGVHGKHLQTHIRFSRVVMTIFLLVAGTTCAQMKPGDVRRAYGEARASVIESLLTTIYPGAEGLCDPALMVRMPGEQPRMVAVPVYVRDSAVGGGLEGVATIELEGKKQKSISEAQHFRRTDRPDFPAELFVFRADIER
jgi:hypothetical protein